VQVFNQEYATIIDIRPELFKCICLLRGGVAAVVDQYVDLSELASEVSQKRAIVLDRRSRHHSILVSLAHCGLMSTPVM
jgi:hypothetical protein